ncbi:aminotransferase class V-fold PLP-dependent enzyme [Microbacterium sp. ASV49]|uniref:Aminotransferase class V-fold PLP-dependent enzyme n=1 Tax=Microbacterium candidum TaxID=3041922 RepID=A0ABT7N074_9MICO|nr:aminotransferase class V-fold PLP-dependent enzyme [Microbacterium sp. ASV49]MDL9980108.1 aminotransferase class V-fold PLP-dependent enzyme [Microbacterium sp. ASV49]
MTPVTLSHADAPAIADAFVGGAGYLSACTTGLPPQIARDAIIADVLAAASGRPDPIAYSAAAERSRAHFARLVSVSLDRVAIGSQTSVLAALVATAVPDGAEVLCTEGDFSSILLPFVHAGRDITVRVAPVHELTTAITADTALVAFSVVQSATGEVADVDGIVDAAARAGALTLCDATQAVGWLPVDASRFDAVVCHAYKWLCSPRGVAFLTLSPRLQDAVRPVFAGWYAGDDPWSSCYGHEVELAHDARRFDVSPAWQAFVGAEPALALFAQADPRELYAYTTGLAAAFRDRCGIPQPERPSAIVTWPDETGCDLARLSAAGITASGRAGRARLAFHVFNDPSDVRLAAAVLGF